MDEQKQLNEIAEHFSMVYGRQFNPKVSKSTKWKRWYASITPQTCKPCLNKNGTLFNEEHPLDETPPLHEHCRCYLDAAMAITAGTATIDGFCGADYFLKIYGRLPENYLSKTEAEAKGWNNKKGNLHELAPNSSIGGMLYRNTNNKLPNKPFRIWYEADINYLGGFRNKQRILYSNDGLLFITYDHYKTFYEITMEN